MKKWTIEIEMNISDNWIADGANPATEAWQKSIKNKLMELLPFAYDSEFVINVTVKKEPSKKDIKLLQGYPINPSH